MAYPYLKIESVVWTFTKDANGKRKLRFQGSLSIIDTAKAGFSPSVSMGMGTEVFSPSYKSADEYRQRNYPYATSNTVDETYEDQNLLFADILKLTFRCFLASTGEKALDNISITLTAQAPAVILNPPVLRLTSFETYILLNWDIVTGAETYKIERSTDNINWAMLKDDQTARLAYDYSAVQSTLYYYRGFSKSGSSISQPSGVVSGQRTAPGPIGTAPGPPSAISISAGILQTTLTWDAGTGANYYVIQRKTDSTSYSEIQQSIYVRSYNDTGLTAGVKYTYKILSVNDVGRSIASDEVSAIPTADTTGDNGGTPGALPDPFGIGGLFTAMGNYYTPFFKPVGDAINSLAVSAFNTIKGAFALDKPVDIEQSETRALYVSLAALGAGAGIYALATATDLLHPLKGTGIVPTAIDITNKLGPGLITGAFIGTLAGKAITTPLGYYYNKILRPYRPGGGVIDQMLFESNITKELWVKLYQYQGWTDELIDAQFKTMFIEPSDRLLVSMFTDPNVPQAWIQKMLKQRGYAKEDSDIITQYAKDTAEDKTRLERLSTITTRFKKGYIIRETFEGILDALRYRKDQKIKIITTAVIEKDNEIRSQRLDLYTEQYQDGVITLAQFEFFVRQIIPAPAIATDYIKLEQTKKEYKDQKAQKTQHFEGNVSIAIQRFVEGMTDSTGLINELKELNRQAPDIELDVIEALRKKQLAAFIKKRKDDEDAKKVAKSGRESGAVTRFIEGFTTDSTFSAELTSIGKTDIEIKLIKTTTTLQKDTNYRKDLIDIYRRAYAVDAISRDDFIHALTPLFADPVVLAQVIALEDVKKLPKPKTK